MRNDDVLRSESVNWESTQNVTSLNQTFDANVRFEAINQNKPEVSANSLFSLFQVREKMISHNLISDTLLKS